MKARFLAMLRLDILHRQLLETVHAGAVAPDVLTREVYAFQQEKRVADDRCQICGQDGCAERERCDSAPGFGEVAGFETLHLGRTGAVVACDEVDGAICDGLQQ